MPPGIAVYVEAGSKRVFAGAIDWPGWCRSARSEEDALEAVASYRDRYAAAAAFAGLKLPAARSLHIVERLRGDATTDFGAPSIAPTGDAATLTAKQMARQVALLRACWGAFDAAAKSAGRKTLSTGPRGGGRQVAAMIEHVLEADRAYVSKLGHPVAASTGAISRRLDAMRATFIEALEARNNGEPDRRVRATTPMWPARYAVRRSSWHALDHAWEIEDRTR